MADSVRLISYGEVTNQWLTVADDVRLRSTREGTNSSGVSVADDVRLRSTGEGTNENGVNVYNND